MAFRCCNKTFVRYSHVLFTQVKLHCAFRGCIITSNHYTSNCDSTKNATRTYHHLSLLAVPVENARRPDSRADSRTSAMQRARRRASQPTRRCLSMLTARQWMRCAGQCMMLGHMPRAWIQGVEARCRIWYTYNSKILANVLFTWHCVKGLLSRHKRNSNERCLVFLHHRSRYQLAMSHNFRCCQRTHSSLSFNGDRTSIDDVRAWLQGVAADCRIQE